MESHTIFLTYFASLMHLLRLSCSIGKQKLKGFILHFTTYIKPKPNHIHNYFKANNFEPHTYVSKSKKLHIVKILQNQRGFMQ